MINSVLIPTHEYLRLVQKEAAFDSFAKQYKAMAEELAMLKTTLEQVQKSYGEDTELIKKLQAAIVAAQKRCEELEVENKDLKDKVAKYKDMAFGNKGKKKDKAEQKPEHKPFSTINNEEIKAILAKLDRLVKEAELERENEKQKTKAEKEANAKSKKEEKRKNLPIIVKHLYPEGYDPQKHILIGKEIKDVYRRIPAIVYIERNIRHVSKDRPDCLGSCDNINTGELISNMDPQSFNGDLTKIYKAPWPVLPFPKVNVGADFIAWVIISKFMFSLPEYRILRMLKQDGISDLSSSTLNDWVKYAAEKLYPLYLQQKKLVMESDYVQGDEVPYNVADQPGKPARKGASFQVLDVSEVGRGCFFEYEGGKRTKEVAMKIFKNYTEAAQFDAYDAYLWLRREGKVTVLSCLAHVVRRFRDCVELYEEEDARIFYNAIQAMYGVDHTLKERNSDYDTIKETRLEKTLPIFNCLEEAAKKVATVVRPKSGFGRALNYFIDNADGIRNVFKDGRYYWDNNPVERHNRTTTLGRKNYLFAKNNDTAENLAIFYTFTETIMELGINAQKYLEHVLNLPLDQMKPEELRNELPYFYAQRQKEAETTIEVLSNPA